MVLKGRKKATGRMLFFVVLFFGGCESDEEVGGCADGV